MWEFFSYPCLFFFSPEGGLVEAMKENENGGRELEIFHGGMREPSFVVVVCGGFFCKEN